MRRNPLLSSIFLSAVLFLSLFAHPVFAMNLSCIYQIAASKIIGTPLEKPARGLRWIAGTRHRRRHPELASLFEENAYIDLLLKTAIAPETNCIDGGAHLGSVTSAMLRRAPKGKHLAIEPMPDKAELLRRKFRNNVVVEEVAIGKEPGTADFYLSKKSGYNSLRGLKSQPTLTVAVDTLDHLVSKEQRIGFIKLDLEGGEHDALLGARELIARDRPVILFECTRTGLDNFGLSPADMYSLFNQTLGYRIFFIRDGVALLEGDRNATDPLTLEAFTGSMFYPFKAFNFVAIPKERI